MAPRVSVLLPVRDGARTLERCLESLLAQTLKDFEIVAVDDGSTDRTPDILSRLAGRDSRLKVLRRPPRGIVAALNEGLEASRGEYIARMDADDICAPERLMIQAAALDADPALGLVACRVSFGGSAEACAGYAEYVRWVNSLLDPEEISLARFRESPLAHPSVMFRREVAAAHGAYRDGPFPEDYELWLRWLEAGVRMRKLPQTLLVWSDSPDRISRTHGRYASEAFYRVKTPFLARWLQRNNPHHPEVYVIGAGGPSRKRARLLLEHGIRVGAWADIDPRKIGNRVDNAPVVHHDDLPEPEHCFVLSYVASRGAADQIRTYLLGRGFREGRHFHLVA